MKIKKQPMLKKTFNLKSNFSFNMYNELCILHCTAADFSDNLKEKETSPGYNLVNQKASSTFYTAQLLMGNDSSSNGTGGGQRGPPRGTL